MEFNEMWNNGGSSGVFGSAKTNNTPHYFNLNGTPVEVYFSPTDQVNTRLIETINTADNDIQFATMLITRSDVAAAIRDRVMSQNIASCSNGLMDDTVGASSQWFLIEDALNNRLQKYNGSHIMHHKYIMVDALAPNSDPTLFAGSHNWSNSAENENDENTVIIHSEKIVNQYYQEFAQRIADQNTTGVSACATVSGVAESFKNSKNVVQVYPNPNNGNFSVQLSEIIFGEASVSLYDVTGKQVFSKNVSATNGTEFTVETTNLSKGIYNLLISNGSAVQSVKVVVQ